MTKKNAGVYLIRHLPSGQVYIGQATNIDSRIRTHRADLRRGNHHNTKLQELWTHSHEDDFQFRPLELAPAGLSPLELQRWLVRRERAEINEAREGGYSLNIARAEIVATTEAIKEYKAQREIQAKDHDRHLSRERKALKKAIQDLQSQIEPLQYTISSLSKDRAILDATLKRYTGWRRIFHKPPPGFDASETKNRIEEVASMIAHATPGALALTSRIAVLEDEYRRLGRAFSKVSESRYLRSSLRFFGRVPKPPKISE